MPKLPATLACLLLAGCATALSPPAPVVTTEVSPPAVPASAAPPGPSPVRSTPREQITALEALYAATDRASPDRPALIRRLAETYVALEAAAHREEGTKPADAAASAQAAVFADAARRKAIEHYRRLADEYPGWCSGKGGGGCGDEVLYYLAFEHEQGKELEDARRAYRELIERFPRSKYVPNAQLAFAEALFDQAAADPAKLAAAALAYEEVLRFPPPENEVAGYAHYKLAYVRWNQNDSPRAFEEMTRAIEVADQDSGSPSSVRLARAARKDLPSLYGAGGDPAKAYDRFARWSGDASGATTRLGVMLDELAQVYLDRGKLPDAVVVYLDLLARGAGPRRCAVVARLDAALAAGKVTPEVKAKVAASAPLRAARGACAAGP